MWLKSNQIKTKVTMCMSGKGQNFLIVKFEITIHDSLFKVHYYMLNAYLLKFTIMYIFLFKLVIMIHKYFCLNIFPYLNKVHFVKSSMWHNKWITLSYKLLTSWMKPKHEMLYMKKLTRKYLKLLLFLGQS
jgi:hypothetical protein